MTKGIVDNIADFMISVVTDYGTAVGCDQMIESALVGNNNREGGDRNDNPHRLVFYDDDIVGDGQNSKIGGQKNRIFSTDGGLLESITESRSLMCFECGVANFRRNYSNKAATNHGNSSNNDVGVDDYGHIDDKNLDSVVSSLPGSDLVFFPTPSSEVPQFFHHPRHSQPPLPSSSLAYHQKQPPINIPSAYPLSRTTAGVKGGKKGRKIIDNTETNQNTFAAVTTIPGVVSTTHHNVSSPPPDVADRWLKMGIQYSHVDNEDITNKFNDEVMYDDEISYAFDEVSLGTPSGWNKNHKHSADERQSGGEGEGGGTHYPFDEGGGGDGHLFTVGISTPRRQDAMSSPFSSSSSSGTIITKSRTRPPLANLSPNSTTRKHLVVRTRLVTSPVICPQRQQQQQQQQQLEQNKNNISSTSNRNTNQWLYYYQQQQQQQQQQHRDRPTNHRRGAEVGGGLTNRLPLRDTMSFVSSSSSSSSVGTPVKKSTTKKDINVTSASAKSHWKSATDAKSGKTYYYHEVTRETQWRKPAELATDEEKRAMAEKERKQKDFFAAMEANILNAVSQGVMPGAQEEEAAGLGRSGSGSSGGGGGRGLGRRMSSRRVSVGPDGRPELVRTISTMDELVLKDLILRQPSYRNMKPGLAKEESLRIEDLATAPSRATSAVRDGLGMGDSWSHDNSSNPNVMPTLQESMRELSMDDSMPELFSYLPDDEDLSTSYGGDDDDDYSEYDDASESRRTDDDSEFNKSKSNSSAGAAGFGLSKGESQALKKLTSITKDMIDSEKSAYNLEAAPAGGATPSKLKRDLPREVDFDDSDDDNDDDESSGDDDGKAPPTTTAVKTKPSATPTFQKATESGSDGRALPREIELDFEDSDDEEDDDDDKGNKGNTTNSKSVGNSKLPSRDEEPLQSASDKLKRPDVKRRNTCSTMYVGTTMSAPDKDATIKCVCGVYRSHILSSAQFNSIYNPDTDPYKIFNDQQDGQKKSERSPSTTTTGSVVAIPSLDEITKFYRDIFFKAQMETDCIIMSIIYVERLIKKTLGKLRPRAENWHSLLFSCMILSSKVWDDLSMWNVDFSQSCPPGVSFSLQRINELELAVLNALSFKVKVKASEYAKYYFLLRSMLIKSGLAGDDLLSLDPLDVRGARRLQEVSSQFENLSLGNNGTGTGTGSNMMSKVRPIQDRSKSLDVRNIGLQQQQKTRTTAGLEQVVKM